MSVFVEPLGKKIPGFFFDGQIADLGVFMTSDRCRGAAARRRIEDAAQDGFNPPCNAHRFGGHVEFQPFPDTKISS